MDTKQIANIVAGIYGVSNRSFRNIRSILKAYKEWCKRNGYDVCEDVEELEMPTELMLDNMRKNMVGSPRHLQFILDSTFDPEEMRTYDNLYRVYYWLSFIGFYENEIAEIKAGDVDFESNVIRKNGNEYPLYKQAIDCFRNAVELNEFVYYHPNYTKPIIRPRVFGDGLMKGIKKDFTLSTFRPTASRKVSAALNEKRISTKLSYSKVHKSGIFYRAYEDELIGIPPTFTDDAINIAANKGKENLNDEQIYMIRYNLRLDYNTWKNAFYEQ